MDQKVITEAICEIEAIKIEVAGAKLANSRHRIHGNFNTPPPYMPEWFFNKAQEMRNIGQSVYKQP